MLMMVLHILLTLFLVILGLAVLATLLILLMPARIQLQKAVGQKPIRIRLGYGPVHITRTLFGEKKAGKRKKTVTKKKPKKEKKETEKKPPATPRFHLERLDVSAAIDLALKLMDDMAGSLTFEKLHVTVIIHTEDAAKTAEILGQACAVTGMLYPELERCFDLRDPKIVLDADFDAQKTVWGVDISVMTRMIRYPGIMLRRRKELWKVWKSIR